jgi:hypothetical protein
VTYGWFVGLQGLQYHPAGSMWRTFPLEHLKVLKELTNVETGCPLKDLTHLADFLVHDRICTNVYTRNRYSVNHFRVIFSDAN